MDDGLGRLGCASFQNGCDFGVRKGGFMAAIRQLVHCGSMFRLLMTSSQTGPSSSKTFLK
jgi:hypothetical protein